MALEQAGISELAIAEAELGFTETAEGQVVKEHAFGLTEAFEFFVAALKHYFDVSPVTALVATASATPVAAYSSSLCWRCSI